MRRYPDGMAPVVLPRPVERRAVRPYLFSYDVSRPANARQVRRCLKRWRIDGQYSVHETFMSPPEAEDLAAELLDYLDPATDRLLLTRLSQRGGAPVFVLSRREPRAPLLGGPEAAWPTRFAAGWYLLAYDICDDKRLRQVHRVSVRVCVFLQKSVCLYHGAGRYLAELLEELGEVIWPGDDDVRVYALNGAADLWFLCGPVPPLADVGGGDGLGQCFAESWEGFRCR